MPRPSGQTAALPAPPYRWGVLVGVAVFALYAATLAPTTAFWDASEYIAAAHILGLPHPPGNPLFVLIGHAVGLLPIPVSYAVKINLLAAASTAFATAIWFLVTDHVLARGGVTVRWRRLFAAAGALAGATAFTVWNQSTVNEKVYTLSLAGFAAITWLMLRWLDDDATWRLLVVALLLGAGYSVHPAGLLPAPAVIIAVAARDWRRFLHPRLVLAVAGMFVLGVTPFIFEPIRAAQFPAIDEGEPTGCTTRLELSCTMSALTYRRLADNIERKQYGKPPVTERQAPFTAQMGMWWLYFRWQWLRDPHDVTPALQLVLALTFLGLGVAGAVAHWRWDRPSFWYWAAFVFTLSVLLVYYMNFKYGASQAPELGDAVPREVRDRDYFFIWSYSAWSVWVALGLAALWRWSGERRGVAALAALTIIPLAANWHAASRRGDTTARDWAVDLLQSVEPYGIIVTNGDNDTFPLWYAQYVEGIRPDVTLALTPYLDTDWFVRQLIRNPVPAYDAAHGPALYRDSVWHRPTMPPLHLTFAQADSIPDYTMLDQPQLFQAHGIAARIPPGYLTRGEIVLLRIINDSFPGRAIYFSPGSPFLDALGLRPYTVRTGLLDRLVATPDPSAMPRMDVATTRALWTIYRGPDAIIRRGDWIDRPSIQPPVNYAVVGSGLADALRSEGDITDAATVEQRVAAVLSAARLR